MSNADNSSWQYKPGDGSASNPAKAQTESISWTSLEYVEHDRGANWYLLLGLLTIVVAALLYLLTRDYFAVGATVAVGIILALSAGHRPGKITYELTNRGIKVGQKSYNYSMFRSFSIIREGNLSSIYLQPVKRLMPPITAYFDMQNEQKIMELVGTYLPYQQSKADPIDRLTQRLRF